LLIGYKHSSQKIIVEDCHHSLSTINPHERCVHNLSGQVEVTEHLVLIISLLRNDKDLLAPSTSDQDLSAIIARLDDVNWHLVLEETQLLNQSRILAVTDIVNSESAKGCTNKGGSSIF
jgi:hypothetical protein